MLALGQQSFYVRINDANKRPIRSYAGYDGIEDLANSMRQSDGCDPLLHGAFYFAGRVFFFGAVLRNLIQFIVTIWRRPASEDSFDESLRHQIRKAAIRRGGVRVILHREAEMSLVGIARTFELPAANG